MSNTQKRKYIIGNVIAMAVVWVTGFDKLPKEKHEQINEVFMRDLLRCKEEAEDPGFLPKPADFQNLFTAMHLSGHVSTIIRGLVEYYHCRQTPCGCITTNATWPSTVDEGGGQYWCPDPS